MNQFKKTIRPFREVLWKVRLYIMGYNILMYFNVLTLYLEHEVNLLSLLISLATTVILILFPFAYGLKSEKDMS